MYLHFTISESNGLSAMFTIITNIVSARFNEKYEKYYYEKKLNSVSILCTS